MAEYQHIWFKFYGQDWLTDPNMISVSAVDRLIYITLLCLASAEGGSGTIKKISERSLIKMTHLEDKDENRETVFAAGVLDRLQAHGLIEINPHVTTVTESRNGNVTGVTDHVTVVLPTFYARQNSFLTAAERMKKHREKAKITPKNKDKKKVTSVTQSRNDSDARGEESRVEKNISKSVYGEFKNVKLTDEEKEKLKQKYGPAEAKKLVDELSVYMESKPTKYKSHYAVILQWARRKGLSVLPSQEPKMIGQEQPDGTIRLVPNPKYHG